MTKFVNRLFLIGNGFDLALGLKTKYSDFLLWLLKKEVIRAIESGDVTLTFEELNKLTDTLNTYDAASIYTRLIKLKGFAKNELFNVIIYDKNQDLASLGSLLNIYDLLTFKEYIKENNITIISKRNFRLMNVLLDEKNKNWVDIESIYFNELKKIINEYRVNGSSLGIIEIINKELTEITKLLKEYLTELKISISKDDATVFLGHFKKRIKRNDFIGLEAYTSLSFPSKSYFLNFNYTDSLSQVLAHFPDFEFIQNFIHGSLVDKDIIFGFGDEMDSIYKEIEELNDNRFFEHIKSFHYFKTNKQRQLQTFLNSGDYQVCVYGHSCGLSDRVMLNEIFEHENCKSILIYYYNDEDFTTKTMEISRHFNNKQIMRKKIVEKRADCKIPQINRT